MTDFKEGDRVKVLRTADTERRGIAGRQGTIGRDRCYVGGGGVLLTVEVAGRKHTIGVTSLEPMK